MVWEPQGHDAGEGSVVKPHMRPFLWAYPNFDPAAELNSSHSVAGTLDDCAAWGGGRDYPLNSSTPGVPASHHLDTPAPVRPSSGQDFNAGPLETRQQQQERLQDRELEARTRQLQHQRHWLLSPSSAHQPPGAPRPRTPCAEAPAVDPAASATRSGRQWKRVCRGEAGDPRAGDGGNEGPDMCQVGGKDEWRRARRTQAGEKLVVYPFPVASADTQRGRHTKATQGEGSASVSRGAGCLSVASTPGGTSRHFGESSVETTEHRVMQRRKVTRMKRKDPGTLVAQNNEGPDVPLKRMFLRPCSPEEASHGRTGVVDPSQGSEGIGLMQDNDMASSGPTKRSRAHGPLRETTAAAAKSRPTPPHIYISKSGGQAELSSVDQLEAPQRVSASPPRAADEVMTAQGPVVKRPVVVFERSGQSTLTSSQLSIPGGTKNVNLARKGSFAHLSAAGRAGMPQNSNSMRNSSSFPLISQAVSCTTSQHTSATAVCSGLEASMDCRSNEIRATRVRHMPGSGSGLATFAPLYQSRREGSKQEEYSLYALPRFDKKDASKWKHKDRARMDSMEECGQASSSDDEASPKFVLSSGRVTATGRPKKHATIDDEFESFFAKLLL